MTMTGTTERGRLVNTPIPPKLIVAIQIAWSQVGHDLNCEDNEELLECICDMSSSLEPFGLDEREALRALYAQHGHHQAVKILSQHPSLQLI